ncbi:MAG: hypothetical protein RLZZ366_2176 [Pseudomonadota bacterium]
MNRFPIIIALLLSPCPALAASGRLPDAVSPVHYDIKVRADASKLSFEGSETVSIKVAKATPVITLNAVDLVISDASIDGQPATVSLDKAAQTVTIKTAKPVGVGNHDLRFGWTGKINQSAAGFFAIDYPGTSGSERLLVTQFEAPDARRFAPMFDEPGQKATFTLTAFQPDGQTAFSNMPVVSKSAAPGGQMIRFAETPKMSSYLLFLGVGNVERKTVMQGKVEIGIITRKGALDQGDYALASAQNILSYYNDYFGVPYPLPKLDMIAAPGSSQFFGAMENWGAILYFERTVLIDPKLTTEGQKQDVYNTVAHEMAHQWFGDLVTMSWWDDLWLNEGFASWMASKVSSDLNPEWKALTQSLSGPRQSGYGLDARATTHPIIQHIKTVDQISQAFDNITYLKGEAVIRMLESSVGADPFRAGVRRYMAKHAYGNTVTDQLWDEVSAASGKPVAAMMHSYTLQGGVPLIRVGAPKCNGGQTQLTLSQSRYGVDEASKKPQTWIVPVRLASGAATTQLNVSGAKPVVATIAGCGPVIVNAGQTSYARTLYTAPHLDAIAKAFPTLALDDQIGVAADSYALAAGGYQSFAPLLALIQNTPTDAAPELWSYHVGRIGGMNDVLKDSAAQTAFKAKALTLLKPLLARTGWEPKAGEPSAIALLREALIPTLGALGDPDVIAQATRYADASFATNSTVTGVTREAALGIWAHFAEGARWATLHEHARTEAGPVAKLQYYRLLGSAKDVTLAQKALDLALTDEAPVPMRAALIAAVGNSHPAMAFDWAAAHATQVNALLEESTKTGFIVELASNSSDPAVAARVKAYALKALAPESRADANASVSRIAYLAALRQKLIPAITAWAK